MRICACLALLLLIGCGDDTEAGLKDAATDSGALDAESPLDASMTDDAATTGDAAAPVLSCEDVAMFGAFDTACERDDDCVIFGDCENALWVAVARSAEAEARALHEKLEYCGGSDGPIRQARCEAQRCVVAPSGELCGGGGSDDDAGAP